MAFLVPFAAYTLLAGMFLAKAGEASLIAAAGFAAAATMWAHVKNPTNSVYLVCLITLLGPIVKWDVPSLGMFTLGDGFLICLGAIYSIKWLTVGLYEGPYAAHCNLAGALFLITVAWSPDHAAEVSGILNVAQIALVYFVTLNEVKTREQARCLINSIGFAVLIAAIMQIYAYSQGTSLLLGTEDFESQSGSIDGIVESQFIKTAFFYGNTIILYTAVAAVGFQYLALYEKASMFVKLYWLLVSVCAIVAGSLGSRTTLIILAALGCAALFLPLKPKSVTAHVKRVLSLLVVGGALALVLWTSSSVILRGYQQEAYQTMFLDSAGSSFWGRTSMWEEALEKCWEFPKEFLFGVGPNVILKDYRTSSRQVEALMTSRDWGTYSGSFHNFVVDYVFHLGAISFVIIMTVTIGTLRRLLRLRWSNGSLNDVAFASLLAIIVFWITGVTLGAAWGKPYLAIAQFYALGHLSISKRVPEHFGG